MLSMFFAPVILIFVVMLAVYAISKLVDEPATEPKFNTTAHCPYCEARIKQGWKACPSCGEKLV